MSTSSLRHFDYMNGTFCIDTIGRCSAHSILGQNGDKQKFGYSEWTYRNLAYI